MGDLKEKYRKFKRYFLSNIEFRVLKLIHHLIVYGQNSGQKSKTAVSSYRFDYYYLLIIANLEKREIAIFAFLKIWRESFEVFSVFGKLFNRSESKIAFCNRIL